MCSKEATLGGLLEGSWLGTGQQKDQAMIHVWNFQPHPQLSREVMPIEEASVKSQSWGLESSQVNTPTWWEGDTPHSTGTDAPVLGTLPGFCLFICILYRII